jgi:hypothetical protein
MFVYAVVCASRNLLVITYDSDCSFLLTALLFPMFIISDVLICLVDCQGRKTETNGSGAKTA